MLLGRDKMSDVMIMGIIFAVSVFIGIVIFAINLIVRHISGKRKNTDKQEYNSILQSFNLGKMKVYYLIIVLLTGFGFVYCLVSYNMNAYTVSQKEAEKDFQVYCDSITEDGYSIVPVKSEDNDAEYAEIYSVKNASPDCEFYVTFKYDKTLEMKKVAFSVRSDNFTTIRNSLPEKNIIDLNNRFCIKKIDASDIDEFWTVDKYVYKNGNQNISEYEFGRTFGTVMQAITYDPSSYVDLVITGYIKNSE